ncbi:MULTISPECIES: cupin domain-containing protein [Burkholderiaceae]|uniref:cupin domain-containing protein n=1 Tax=Burkholderiaceae TaxID=119060 RepID=UPI00097826B7|nr:MULTISPECIES: cupin domain-containing protein [Burkholderiaceae]MCG1039453.1 cupin domain-containing protein [Mycetohabitans sp. B7]
MSYVLQAGDALLLPQGGAHELLFGPDVTSRSITAFKAATLCKTVVLVDAVPRCAMQVAARAQGRDDAGDTPDDALIFSACMEFDLGGMQPLVASMPKVMLVGTLLERCPEIGPMLDAMERESCGERAGFAGILSRLADVVATFIIRGWVECGCGDATGWVQALRDPRLSRATQPCAEVFSSGASCISEGPLLLLSAVARVCRPGVGVVLPGVRSSGLADDVSSAMRRRLNEFSVAIEKVPRYRYPITMVRPIDFYSNGVDSPIDSDMAR